MGKLEVLKKPQKKTLKADFSMQLDDLSITTVAGKLTITKSYRKHNPSVDN